ncbi:MAG: CerR family C-terminal domain-containing protein [Campylobacteraceae bacterium]|jgi:AcrR family transcriptional regulator|nr:CerR family C-terminal domain-containing protein [Campylobacteraceae bacterium]
MLLNQNKRFLSKSARERIFETAVKMFANNELSSVSAEDIALEADVNTNAVIRHFGSKELLYLNVIECIAIMLQSSLISFQTHYYRAKQSFEYTSEEEYRNFLIFWFEKFIKISVKSILEEIKINNFMHKIVFKEYISPTAGFDVLYNNFLKQWFDQFDEFIFGISTNKDIYKNRIRTHALYGQILIFTIGYTIFGTRTGSKEQNIKNETIDSISDVVLEHTRYIIDGIS